MRVQAEKGSRQHVEIILKDFTRNDIRFWTLSNLRIVSFLNRKCIQNRDHIKPLFLAWGSIRQMVHPQRRSTASG